MIVGCRPALAQLMQRIGAERREQQQPSRLQYPGQFAKDRIGLVAPLQHQVAVDEIDAVRGERQRARIAADARRSGAPPPAGAGCGLQHALGEIDRQYLCAWKSATQLRGRLAGAGAEIEYALGSERKELQAIEQIGADLALPP